MCIYRYPSTETLPNKTSLDLLGVASETMHLCVFLAFVLWGSESHCAPVKVTTMTLQKSHTARFSKNCLKTRRPTTLSLTFHPSPHTHTCVPSWPTALACRATEVDPRTAVRSEASVVFGLYDHSRMGREESAQSANRVEIRVRNAEDLGTEPRAQSISEPVATCLALPGSPDPIPT